MKQIQTIFVLFILVFLVSCYQLKVNPEDVWIEATLKLNENERVKDKDYLLEVLIEKNHGGNMIYPYMKGLYNMTFDDEDEEAFFQPDSIGRTGADMKLVVNELQKHSIMMDADEAFSSLLGFYTPEETGKYKLRMYFQKGEENVSFDNMYLVYVHYEDGKNKWAKSVKITPDIK